MAIFDPPDIVRAPKLRDWTYEYAMLRSDKTTQQTAPLWADVPGLALQLRPNCRYLFDGWFGMAGGSTGDISIRFAAPPNVLMNWTAFGAQTSNDSAIGPLNSKLVDPFNVGFDSVTLPGGTSPVAIQPMGRISTRGFGGPLQVQMARATEGAVTVEMWIGSWLRMVRTEVVL